MSAVASKSELPVDPRSVSAEVLAELVPTLGLFHAEDVATWRDAHGGTFPDEETLVNELGLDRELAVELSQRVTPAETVLARRSQRPSVHAPVRSLSTQPQRAASTPPVALVPRAPEAKVVVLDVARASSANDAAPAAPATPAPAVPAMAPALDVAAKAALVAKVAALGAASATGAATAAAAPAGAAAPAAPDAPDAPAGAAAPAAPTRSRRALVVTLLLVLVGANVGVVAGLAQTRSEQRKAIAPIATIAADVGELKTVHAELKAAHAETNARVDETRAALDETRRELAKTEHRLETVADDVKDLGAHQKTEDHELDELKAREARDVAGLASKLRLAERRAADGSYTVSIGEAMSLIDAVKGPAGAPSSVPAHATKGGPAHAHGETAAPASHEGHGHFPSEARPKTTLTPSIHVE